MVRPARPKIQAPKGHQARKRRTLEKRSVMDPYFSFKPEYNKYQQLDLGETYNKYRNNVSGLWGIYKQVPDRFTRYLQGRLEHFRGRYDENDGFIAKSAVEGSKYLENEALPSANAKVKATFAKPVENVENIASTGDQGVQHFMDGKPIEGLGSIFDAVIMGMDVYSEAQRPDPIQDTGLSDIQDKAQTFFDILS